MPDISETVVGEKFWLRRAQIMVEGAVDRSDAAASRLTSAIAWFWTVYTGAAVAGVALGDRQYSAAKSIALASPAVLLLVAYGAALWATLPIHVRFDPLRPDEIREVHERIARSKRARLLVAFVLTLLAAIDVAVAVIVIATSHAPAP